jgi:adenine-specific DNA-methyltransferase
VKINKNSKDIVESKLNDLKKIFPEFISEEKIDFNKLKNFFEKKYSEKPENFFLSWAGRSESIKNLQTSSRGTLIPDKDESVNFDETENIFIEGENLEVLKLLQKSYTEKIKMIYIDPPYNTGNDFIYKDDFSNNLESYLKQTGQSKDGVKLTTNTETGGKLHSNWLSFMYPRLSLARELLTEDGIIFVSIGDDELSNLIFILNEIFDEENKIGIISRQMKSGSNKGDFFSPNIDYVLVYAKNIDAIDGFRLPLEGEYVDRIYTQIEKSGPLKGERYRTMGLYQASLESRINQRYWIKCPDGSFVIPPGKSSPTKLSDGEKITPNSGDGVWRWSVTRYFKESKNNNLVFKETKTSSLLDEKGKKSKWNVYTKIWLKDRLEEGRVPTNLITQFENRHSAAELKELEIPFDYAKPSKLISYLISFFNEKEFTILDFFAGSGTTAHSVIDSNRNDSGNRKFICVQIPENCSDDSDAKKMGFNTIADICKERIRRVIKSTEEKNIQSQIDSQIKPDLDFRVFKLAKSNYKIWEDIKDEKKLKDQLKLFEDPLVEKYNDIDVIYEIIIKEGYSLNSKIEIFKEKLNKIYKVSDGEFFFYVTLDKTLDEKSFNSLSLEQNTMFVCLDSALDDSQKINLEKQCKLRVI